MLNKSHVWIAAATSAATLAGSASAAVVEDWQMNDTAGTQYSDLTNDAAGGGTLGGDTAQATADGNGNLQFSQGADASDNVFRNSSVARNLSTGTVTLSFSISAADLSGGDATGANAVVGLREETTNTDIVLLRLHKQSGTLRLQTRIGGANTNLENFGVDVLAGALDVTATIDLDADTMDVTWTYNGGAAQTSTGIAVTDVEYDWVRTASNTNTDDFGANDFVDVDYITVDYVVPEPGSAALGLAGALLIGARRR